jgi:hypothetical protein
MDDKLRETLETALDHYQDMITYAEQQPEDSRVEYVGMERSIYQSWFGPDCSFCKVYSSADDQGNTHCDDECPLLPSEGGRLCCEDLWEGMAFADLWKDWLFYARAIFYYMQYICAGKIIRELKEN